MKKLYVSSGVAAVALLLVLAPISKAAEFIGPGNDDNGNVTISSGQSHHNLYVAGGSTTIDGATTGDLFASAGTLIVNGPVEQDATVAGGTVIVNSKVGGDLRVFGGTVNVNESVGGDLLIFGGTVVVAEKATIAGDVIACGGTITMNGPIAGSMRASGGSITLNSAINGAVNVRTSKELVFGSSANIAGSINHTGPKQAVVKDGAKVSAINYQESRARGGRRHAGGILTLAFVLKLLAWIAGALVLLRFLPGRVRTVVESVRNSPWSNLGIGFAALILVPIAAIILAITMIGFYVAFLLIVPYIFFLGISCLTAAILVGGWVVKKLTKKEVMVLDWQAATIGVVIFALVGLIPIVGWLFVAILSLMAFGGYVRWARGVAQAEQA